MAGMLRIVFAASGVTADLLVALSCRCGLSTSRQRWQWRDMRSRKREAEEVYVVNTGDFIWIIVLLLGASACFSRLATIVAGEIRFIGKNCRVKR